MTYDRSETIEAFVVAAASKQPVPGGGSVAALAGALAAAMGEMAINYSVGRKATPQFDAPLKAALLRLSHARALLLELMVEDQDAYQALRNAKKLPEGEAGRAALPQLIQACVNVPQAIGATALAILAIAEDVAGMVNPYLLSDLAICADLAMATVRAASYNVKVNLPELPDAAVRAKGQADMDAMMAHATSTIQRASSAIWAKR